MGLFGKKKKQGSPAKSDQAPDIPSELPGPTTSFGIPSEQVFGMRQQGMDNNQIVQTLQRDGYKSSQVFDAMSQADLAPGTPQQMQQEPLMDSDPGFSDMLADNRQMDFQQQEYEDFQPPVQENTQGFGTREMDRIEEVAEAIIDEKWNELMKNINKIIEWKERIESRINSLEKQIEDIKTSLDTLNKRFIGKMEDYDKSMGSIGIEIKAMEKVFQKMLPTFTENISELSRITKDIKNK